MLVTGGAGFIGSNFVRYWLEAHPDDDVVNLDLLTYAGRLENLADIQDNPRYSFIQGDIADPEVVQRAMQGVDTVVHFAAETHVDRSVSGPAAFVRTNVTGTFTLLEAAREAAVKRFHHVSTDEVFGSLGLDDGKRFNETTPYDPRSPYSASKAASDHLVRAYFHTFGLPITISNCSNNYGPYQFPEKLFPVLILKGVRGEQLPVYGNGRNVRDWIHVEDHNRGIECILEKGTVGETYCLGGNSERANIDIAKSVLRELGCSESEIEKRIVFVQDRPGHDLRYAIDSTKAEQELGWKRQHTFESGLAATVAWYRDRASDYTVQEEGVHARK